MEHSKNILVIEDQLLVALDFENQLRSFGYSPVNNATNYRQAIKRINDTNPDLILLDIILKDGPTGFKVAKVAQAKNIPIVFVTASTQTSFFKKAKEYHPKAILHKPVNTQELKHAVDKLFN
ncbi:MAG TPA: response regulator [Ignavibacteriaceae bacterium]|nr:response regulator [Ignavibacteriaceae bacterium]